MSPRRAALVLLPPLLVAAAVAAQPPETVPPTPAFGASVEVELVEVEVFVSDGHGAPVTGLGAADFVLSVDGERREIAGLYESMPRAELSQPTLTMEPAGEEPTAAPTPVPSATDADRRLSLVVLLDELHLQPGGRKRTLDRIGGLLDERLAAGDRVLLATLDRSLAVRRAFDATGPIATDLAAIYKRAPGGIHNEVERRQTLSQIRDLYADNGCEALGEMQALASAWRGDVERESRLTLEALQTLLESLAGRSGRKALLLVTEGMSLTPGLEADLLLEELCNVKRVPSTGLAAPLSRVVAAANAAQVTLYTLDAGGQRVLASALDPGPGLSMANQVDVRADTQDPAFALAVDTGGKALLESNRPELLLADLAQDLAAYYSLAFTPRPGDAGRAHRIRVEVRRPGVRVRHRSSWDPQTAAERLEGRLLAALRFGGEESNPLGARLEADVPHGEADGSFTVPLRLVVPASALTLVPHGNRRQGSLRVLLAVRDGEGRTTPVRALPLPVDLPALLGEGAADGATVPLQVRLKLRQGRNTIAVAVHDEVGQATSLIRREVTVGAVR